MIVNYKRYYQVAEVVTTTKSIQKLRQPFYVLKDFSSANVLDAFKYYRMCKAGYDAGEIITPSIRSYMKRNKDGKYNIEINLVEEIQDRTITYQLLKSIDDIKMSLSPVLKKNKRKRMSLKDDESRNEELICEMFVNDFTKFLKRVNPIRTQDEINDYRNAFEIGIKVINTSSRISEKLRFYKDKTPLCIALLLTDDELAKTLIEAGADVNERGLIKYTIYYIERDNKNDKYFFKDGAELLIANGLDTSQSLIEMFFHPVVVYMLIDNGAVLPTIDEIHDYYIWTPYISGDMITLHREYEKYVQNRGRMKKLENLNKISQIR